jgi:hypothetical protein
MTKPDKKVAIASRLLILLALAACNHTTATPAPNSAPSDAQAQPGTDAPMTPADSVSGDAPASPVDAVVPTSDSRESGEAHDAREDGVCTIATPIAGADCDKCLAQHCCQQAQQCPSLAMLQGGPFGPGCRNGLRCVRQCPDAGACQLTGFSPVCSNGIGPQGGAALMAFLSCAGQSCSQECAQGL